MLVEPSGADVRLHPVGPVDAVVRLPGSKSLTNRYLLCMALADGHSTLRAASLSDDALRMIDGLRRLGIHVELHDDAELIEIRGCRGQIPAGEAELDAGNAGTAMRFLTALACLGRGRYRLDGSARMRERPIGQLVGALQELGAGIGHDEAEGYPPLTMVARGLAGGQVELVSPLSSQFVSALLMVAPYATRDVLIRITGEVLSRPYMDMTIKVMRSLGVEVLASDDFDRFVVPATQRYRADDIAIEPDASAATYFWAAAAISGGRVRVRGLSCRSLQGDAGFVDVLERMGCQVEEREDALGVKGPPAGTLRGIDIDLNAMPDAAQTLAVVALFATGPTRISNVANLRIKETDRLAALESELIRLGARVEMSGDGLTITPPAQITPAAIETYDDHRMVMSFALVGLGADGIVVKGADCVSKSFPDFFGALARLEPTS
ncbi:MAG: 3-phosphoshikimate 1-carboxyvinyltransferase [Phycisphaerae bacterium]